jgi:hypothetical protein
LVVGQREEAGPRAQRNVGEWGQVKVRKREVTKNVEWKVEKKEKSEKGTGYL